MSVDSLSVYPYFQVLHQTIGVVVLHIEKKVRQRSDYELAARPEDAEGDCQGRRMSFGHSLLRQKVYRMVPDNESREVKVRGSHMRQT